MTEIEIGRAKRGRQAYAFDDIAIVPSRRTRDPEEVSVAWQIDAYRFELPVAAAPMDSVMSPATAVALGRLGGGGAPAPGAAAWAPSTAGGGAPSTRPRSRCSPRSQRSIPPSRPPACRRSTPRT